MLLKRPDSRFSSLLFPALLAVGGMVAPYLLTAAEAQPAAQTASAAASRANTRKVSVRGDKYREKGGIYNLNGNVKITSEDSILTTDAAAYNKQTKIATSPGPLKIEDSLNTITGKRGTAYYTSRDAKIRENVVIVAKPRPEDRNAPPGSARREFDAPATITCDSVDYNWGTRVAVLTGNLKIVQKERTVTAKKAIYDAKTEIVKLEGDVVYVNSKNGDRFEGEKATIGVKQGEEFFEADNVKGSFTLEDEVETTPPPAENSAPAPAAPKPGTGGAGQ
ncbi:MAG: hypothetical protein OHK0029_31430 [Armatimonadaceae bacterium]